MLNKNKNTVSPASLAPPAFEPPPEPEKSEIPSETKSAEAENYATAMEHVDKIKRKMDDEVRERMAHLKGIENDLQSKATELEQKSKELDIRHNELDKKERTLQESEKTKQAALSDDSLKSVKALEKQLRSKDKQLDQQANLIQRQRKEILDKKAELEGREKKILEKEDALLRKEEIIESIDKELSKLKEEVDEKHLHIEESKLSIDNREKKLKELQAFVNERETALLDMKQGAANEILSMRTEAEHIDDELKTKKELLHEITEQYDGKMNSIREAEAILKEKELSIIERVKDLEEDEEILKQKETELIQRVADIEEDERLLEEKEKEIIDMMNKFEERKSNVALLREIKRNKKLLSEKENSLLKAVKKLEKTKQDIDFGFRSKTVFEKKMDELKQKELWLIDREKRFDSIVNEEIQKRQLYGADMEREISPEPIAAVVQRQTMEIDKDVVSEAFMPVVPKEELPEKGTKKVEYLLNVARNYLTTENLEFARKTLAIAEGEYRKLRDDDERRVLEYSIMELKTDIDLASLG